MTPTRWASGSPNSELPECGRVMATVSEGRVVIPAGDTVLKAGDEVSSILAQCEDESLLRRAFGIDE